MKPLARFRIYPENRALYYVVCVWRTLKEFRAACPGNSHALGLCRGFRVLKVFGKGDQRRERMRPVLGEIHFVRYHLRAGIIAHELTHALFGWMAERGIPLDLSKARNWDAPSARLRSNSPEERACYAMGEMYRQTCVHLTKRKLI